MAEVPIVGLPAEVAAVVRSLAARGRLTQMTVPRPVGDGRVAVTVRLTTTAHAAGRVTVATAGARGQRPASRTAGWPVTGRQVAVTATAGAAVLAAAVGLGVAVFWLVRTWWPLLLTLAVIAFLLRRKLRG